MHNNCVLKLLDKDTTIIAFTIRFFHTTPPREIFFSFSASPRESLSFSAASLRRRVNLFLLPLHRRTAA
jgi:hypothetical protein